MSDRTSFPSRPFVPTEATVAFYEALQSRRPAPSQAPASSPKLVQLRAASHAPSDPSTAHVEPSATSSEQPTFIDDIFAEFREWCETKRTCWPTSLVEFLSYYEYMLAKDLGDANLGRGHQTRLDYSWVPSILCDIFHSSLFPEPMLNILEYFLSLLSILILSDATTAADEAPIFRDLLIRTVAPSADDLTLAPDFLGSLDPADASDHTSKFNLEPEEISLVRDIRRQLYLHIIEPQ